MLNPLSTHFKMIVTNTGASSIQEAVDKADAVLLCERHTHKLYKYEEANSKAIDFLWTPQGKFLVEGPAKEHVPFARPEILASAVIWEDTRAIDKMFTEVEKEKIALLNSYTDIVAVLSHVCFLNISLQVPEEESDSELSDEEQTQQAPAEQQTPVATTSAAQTIAPSMDPDKVKELFKSLKVLKKSPVFASLTLPDRKEFTPSHLEPLFKGIAQEWCNYLSKNANKDNELFEVLAGIRNQMLGNALMKAHQEGFRKIVGVAGSDHLKIPKNSIYATPRIVEAITHLYQSLEEAGISYVTLKATNKHLPPEASTSTGKKRSAPTEEEGPRKRQEIDPSLKDPIQLASSTAKQNLPIEKAEALEEYESADESDSDLSISGGFREVEGDDNGAGLDIEEIIKQSRGLVESYAKGKEVIEEYESADESDSDLSISGGVRENEGDDNGAGLNLEEIMKQVHRVKSNESDGKSSTYYGFMDMVMEENLAAMKMLNSDSATTVSISQQIKKIRELMKWITNQGLGVFDGSL